MNIYNKMSKMLCLLLCAVLFLTSCAEKKPEKPEVSEKEIKLSVEEAKKLIENDAEIADIFVGCILAEGADYSAPNDEKYSSYESIIALCENTYTESCGETEYFKNYPLKDVPSVKNAEGKSLVISHPGSVLRDKAITDSVKVKNNMGGKAEIIVKTEKGAEVSLAAVYENEKWLLEISLHTTLSDIEYIEDKNFPFSDMGSLSGLNGKILVVEMFVFDRNDKFSDDEESAFAEKTEKAFSFIKDRAAEYGEALEFDFKKIYFENSVVFNARPLEFDIMMYETGFGNLRSFVEANYNTEDYDNYVVAVCINKPGYSTDTFYSRYENTESTDVYYAERVFVTENSEVYDIAACILSLAGMPNTEDIPNNGYYKIYFPKDFSLDRENGTSLSPLAAYASGIINKLYPLYGIFLPTEEAPETDDENENN